MPLHLVGRKRVVLVGIVASLALLLGGGAIVQFQAARSWNEMEQKVLELRTAWENRERRREPAWGEGTSERAFEHYERASGAGMALCSERNDALMELLPTRGDDLPATDLRAAWQPLLAHLRAGAHATDLMPRNPYAAPETVIMNLLPLRWVANCALFEARVLRHEDRDVEAVRVSLDAATLGADLLRHDVLINRMIGGAVLTIAMEAWHDDGAVAHLDHDALAALAEGLARLDRSPPATVDLTGELLTTAYALQHLPDGPDAVSAWHYGFSARWLVADEWFRYANGVEDASQSALLPWPQQKARLEADAEREGRGCLLMPVAHALLVTESSVRWALARLRLLRMAVEVHRGRDVPPLLDPLGDGALQVAREGNGVRLRSAGRTEHHLLERFVAR